MSAEIINLDDRRKEKKKKVKYISMMPEWVHMPNDGYHFLGFADNYFAVAPEPETLLDLLPRGEKIFIIWQVPGKYKKKWKLSGFPYPTSFWLPCVHGVKIICATKNAAEAFFYFKMHPRDV